MCGCNHQTGFKCETHAPEAHHHVGRLKRLADFTKWTSKEALRYVQNLRETYSVPTGPVRRIPITVYIQRIRAGVD